LEVLADFRPDLVLLDELAAITDPDTDDALYPTAPDGTVPSSWLDSRCAGIALLHGHYVDVRSVVNEGASDNAALADQRPVELNQDIPELAEALRVHGLAWH
jgi:hypothetical protein